MCPLFIVCGYYPRLAKWTSPGARWLRNGNLVQVDDVADGLVNAPAHLERMLRGQHLGKALVRIGPDRV